jgi:hypothetical protein
MYEYFSTRAQLAQIQWSPASTCEVRALHSGQTRGFLTTPVGRRRLLLDTRSASRRSRSINRARRTLSPDPCQLLAWQFGGLRPPNLRKYSGLTNWWASDRLSTGSHWKCWLYCHARNGVGNRLPGLGSNRIPLARGVLHDSRAQVYSRAEESLIYIRIFIRRVRRINTLSDRFSSADAPHH